MLVSSPPDMTSFTNPEAIEIVKDAVPVLIPALQDPDEDVHAYLVVLGQIGEGAVDAVPAQYANEQVILFSRLQLVADWKP